jgi:hypothetical protein
LEGQFWRRLNLPNNNYEQVTEIIENRLTTTVLARQRGMSGHAGKISQLETIFEVAPLAYLRTSLKFERSHAIALESRRSNRVSSICVTDH